jgi:hypothetical protein
MIWYYVGAMYYIEFLYYWATNMPAQCQYLGNGYIGCTGSW